MGGGFFSLYFVFSKFKNFAPFYLYLDLFLCFLLYFIYLGGEKTPIKSKKIRPHRVVKTTHRVVKTTLSGSKNHWIFLIR